MADRRLPIYFLVDCSKAGTGEHIEVSRRLIQTIVDLMRQDPHCLETTNLSVITFSAAARLECPLTELIEFKLPKLDPSAGNGTVLGQAFQILEHSIANELRPTTSTQKGDWNPTVFLLLANSPTDDYVEAADRLKQSRKLEVIAMVTGPEVVNDVFKAVTEYVFNAQGLNPDDIRGWLGSLFRWTDYDPLSQSVSCESIVLPQPPIDSPPTLTEIRIEPSLTRRCLVYFVFDATAGMAGSYAEAGASFIRTLLQELRNDPLALERVNCGLIACSQSILEIQRPVELQDFKGLSCSFASHNRFGGTLSLVWSCVKRDYRALVPPTSTSKGSKGDYGALIVFLTAGLWDDFYVVVQEQIEMLERLKDANRQYRVWLSWVSLGKTVLPLWTDEIRNRFSKLPGNYNWAPYYYIYDNCSLDDLEPGGPFEELPWRKNPVQVFADGSGALDSIRWCLGHLA